MGCNTETKGKIIMKGVVA